MISENAAMNALLAFQRQTEALSSIAERLSWDQETVMHGAPLPEALAHQIGAVALFVLIIRARHHARYPYETSVRGTIR